MFKWIFFSFIFTPCCKYNYTVVKTMLNSCSNFCGIASRTYEVEQGCMLLGIIILLLNYFCSVT